MSEKSGELIEAVAAGSVAAFESLYDQCAPTIFALLLRILRREEDAEEVLQETFAQVWTRASTYDASRGRAIAWLIQIARSRAIDRIRSSKVRRQKEEAAIRENSLASPAVEQRTAYDDAALAQSRRAVREAIDEIPSEQRIAIELACFEGLTHTEIAERLREPLGTVKTRIHLGMKKLRAILGTNDDVA